MLTASERFLQTAVIVDDEAYVARIQDPDEPASLGNNSLPETSAELPEPGVSLELHPSHAIDVEAVVRGFADIGIACAALAPESTSSPEVKRVSGLAQRADIVILDWRISQPAGGFQTSLNFLEAIVRSDVASGARLRLICIYTGESDLLDILGQISTSLSSLLDKEVVVEDGLVTVGALRVVALSKPQAGKSEADTVSSGQLAARVVELFFAFAETGLLPSLALASTGALRDNVHRILARFSSDYDAAFLSHRAMVGAAAAEQFAIEMLGEELGSVVATAQVAETLGDEAIERRVDELLKGLSEPRSVFKGAGGKPRSASLALARTAFVDGIDSNGSIELSDGRAVLKDYRSIASLLVGGDVEDSRLKASQIDLDFSMISGFTRDQKNDGPELPPPTLFLGSVLRRVRRRKTEYLLCLQPLCDSVRIHVPTPFPLLPLKVVPASDRFELVAWDSKHVSLTIHGSKFRSIEMESFTPNAAGSVDGVWQEDHWQFISRRRTKYRWLGQVRGTKAQSIANAVAVNASRVGMNEYEYLRKSARE